MISKRPAKTSRSPASAAETTAHEAPSKDKRIREVALHHANLIQARKDAENLIFSATCELLDFPSANPAPQSDIRAAKALLAPFTPQDYDALLHERQAADKCGYILCPNASEQGKQGHRSEKKILWGRRGELKVIARTELERWCSENCQKKATYIRVQLNEEPAWTRTESQANRVNLPEEKEKEILQSQRQFVLPIRLKRADAESIERSAVPDIDVGRQMAALRLERQDQEGSLGPSAVLESEVVERRATRSSASAPSPDSPSSAAAIEGYEPRRLEALGRGREKDHGKDDEDDDDDDDGEDRDWDLS